MSQKTVKINLNVWHTEIVNDELIIYGHKENGSCTITTKIHVNLKDKNWLPEQMCAGFIKYLRDKANAFFAQIRKIKDV